MAEIMKQKSDVKSPFDVLDIMFSGNESLYKTVTKKDKERNFFIINRRLSIGYPIQAFKLSAIGIDSESAIDCWWQITKKWNGRKPRWYFLKTDKEKKELKSVEIKYTDRAKEYYINSNNITVKDFELAIKFEPLKMKKFLDRIETHLKQISKYGKQ